jgi:hypothetical protein
MEEKHQKQWREKNQRCFPLLWLLGGFIGFFVLNGWMPFLMDGWWYGTFKDAYVGNPVESIEAVLLWLFVGPIEGFAIGFFLVRWLDKRRIKAPSRE